MKILQVYKDVFPEVHGGIERYIHDLSQFLVSRGHCVEILVAGGGNRDVNGLAVKGVWSPVRVLSNPVAPGFSRFLSETDADVVHFHLPLPSAVLAWTVLKKKRPYVVTYHSDIVRQAFVMPVYGPVLARFLAGAHRVIVSSDNYIRTSRYLRNLRNTRTIPIGTDLERFKPDEAAGKTYYLFVGRFRRYKGIFVLLDAWRKMANPPDLILAGGGGLVNKVNTFIAEHHLPVSVVSNVSDEELVSLYQGARALILPSTQRSEAFGMVQVEAMACGTAVISSNLPTGVSWVNSHGETGLLFTPGDSSDLCRVVARFEESETMRAVMYTKARNRAEALFNSRTLLRRVEECLTEATGI
ncbi:MAG: glycosyltransferase [Candidatus Fermentibacteraceae bacterium]|nr:glycosyltransferase [Candidatus Fermentibacteraceae bacterium]